MHILFKYSEGFNNVSESAAWLANCGGIKGSTMCLLTRCGVTWLQCLLPLLLLVLLIGCSSSCWFDNNIVLSVEVDDINCAVDVTEQLTLLLLLTLLYADVVADDAANTDCNTSGWSSRCNFVLVSPSVDSSSITDPAAVVAVVVVVAIDDVVTTVGTAYVKKIVERKKKKNCVKCVFKKKKKKKEKKEGKK